MAVIAREGKSLFFPLNDGVKSGVKMVPDKPTEKQKKLYFAVGQRLGYDAIELETEAKKIYKLVSFDNISGTEMSALNKRLIQQFQKMRERERKYGKNHIHRWECVCGDRLFVNMTIVPSV